MKAHFVVIGALVLLLAVCSTTTRARTPDFKAPYLSQTLLCLADPAGSARELLDDEDPSMGRGFGSGEGGGGGFSLGGSSFGGGGSSGVHVASSGTGRSSGSASSESNSGGMGSSGEVSVDRGQGGGFSSGGGSPDGNLPGGASSSGDGSAGGSSAGGSGSSSQQTSTGTTSMPGTTGTTSTTGMNGTSSQGSFFHPNKTIIPIIHPNISIIHPNKTIIIKPIVVKHVPIFKKKEVKVIIVVPKPEPQIPLCTGKIKEICCDSKDYCPWNWQYYPDKEPPKICKVEIVKVVKSLKLCKFPTMIWKDEKDFICKCPRTPEPCKYCDSCYEPGTGYSDSSGDYSSSSSGDYSGGGGGYSGGGGSGYSG